MIRTGILAALLLTACGSTKSSSSTQDPPAKGEVTHVDPPGAKGVETVGAQTGAPAAADQTDDPKRHLQPDEGTLAVGKAEGKAGAEATATITVTPAANFHISQEYPTSLTLEAPAGVKLAKTELAKADAAAFNEKTLQFAVKATPEKAGTYEIKGWFKFGVCDPSSCHPKKQPVSISVAAN
jgi:hypothetical protein